MKKISNPGNTIGSDSGGAADLPVLAVERDHRRGFGVNEGHRRKVLAILVLLAALVGGLSLLRGSKAEPESTAAPVSESVYALGRLEPEGELISLAAPGGAGEARIESLRVVEGDAVHAGDLLAVLDSEKRLVAAVALAQSTVAQAETALARTQLDIRTTRNQLEASLRAAEADLVQAEANATRYRELAAAEAVTRERNEDVQLKLKTAREATSEAVARLERYRGDEGGENIDIVFGRREVEAAKAALQQAEANLADSRILAPSDGMILKIRARPGERIGQEAFIEMGRTSDMMARVEVYESEVPHIEVGQKAVLSASPLADPLHGTVTSISKLVQQQWIIEADPAADTDARVMETWVRLDEESSTRAAEFVNLQVRVEFVK